MFTWWRQEAQRGRYEVRSTGTSDDDKPFKDGKENQPKRHVINSLLTSLLGPYWGISVLGFSTQISLLRRLVFTKTSGEYFLLRTLLLVDTYLVFA